MNRSFRSTTTERLWSRQRTKNLDPRIERTALRKLVMVDAAVTLEDLKVPPGNRLEALNGDRAGQHSIRVNQQWRICSSTARAPSPATPSTRCPCGSEPMMTRPEPLDAPVLQAIGVSAGYGFGSKSATVLHNVDLAVSTGRTMGLVGESGSGKSTLAKVLVGQLAASAGRVLLAGADLGVISGRDLRTARRTIQLIPQDPYASLDRG